MITWLNYTGVQAAYYHSQIIKMHKIYASASTGDVKIFNAIYVNLR